MNDPTITEMASNLRKLFGALSDDQLIGVINASLDRNGFEAFRIVHSIAIDENTGNPYPAYVIVLDKKEEPDVT